MFLNGIFRVISPDHQTVLQQQWADRACADPVLTLVLTLLRRPHAMVKDEVTLSLSGAAVIKCEERKITSLVSFGSCCFGKFICQSSDIQPAESRTMIVGWSTLLKKQISELAWS